MAKQLLREGIWRSGRLRRCGLEAHLSFAFLFPIADHWGRWEYDLPLIHSTINVRGDITLEKLKGWLDELEERGLFRRYEVGDKTYAAWMNYAGMPVSQRSPSQLPSPPFDNSMADLEGREILPRAYGGATPSLDIGGGGGGGGGEGAGLSKELGDGSKGDTRRSSSSGPASAREAGQEPGTMEMLLALMLECSDGRPEDRVFRFWQLATGHPRSSLTDARRRTLRLRIREEAALDPKTPVEGLFRAVAGAVLDPYFSGENERAHRYWDFENIFVHQGRNRIERLQAAFDRARAGVPSRPPEKPRTRGGKVAQWLKDKHKNDA